MIRCMMIIARNCEVTMSQTSILLHNSLNNLPTYVFYRSLVYKKVYNWMWGKAYIRGKYNLSVYCEKYMTAFMCVKVSLQWN